MEGHSLKDINHAVTAGKVVKRDEVHTLGHMVS